MSGMSVTDRFLANNQTYRTRDHARRLPVSSPLALAIVACMDARMDVYAMLGLRLGEAHVIRNAGGIVTDDALRSLIISQRMLGTSEIMLIGHTDCGMLRFEDEQLHAAIASDVGETPPFTFGAFTDLEAALAEGMQRIRDCRFLAYNNVRGFIFDVETGGLNEVREPERSR